MERKEGPSQSKKIGGEEKGGKYCIMSVWDFLGEKKNAVLLFLGGGGGEVLGLSPPVSDETLGYCLPF